MNPSSTLCEPRTLRKNVVQAFWRHQDHRNPTSGATSTMRAKTNGRNKTMLEVSQFSPRGCRALTKILSDSLKCDPRTHNFKKEDMFRHDVQLLDRQNFPRSSRNLDRKIALWWPLFVGPYLSSPNSVSRKSGTLKKRVAQDFQWYQER